MSCSCKNKQQNKPVMVQQNNAIQIMELEQPPYTKEEVLLILQYFEEKLIEENKKVEVLNFNKKYFEPQQIGYCDQNCYSRILKRAQYALTKIEEYERYKQSR